MKGVLQIGEKRKELLRVYNDRTQANSSRVEAMHKADILAWVLDDE